MKLTKQLIVTLIEEAIEVEIKKRPWYHGPWESDWDREQKTKECDDGNQEACDDLKAGEEEWTRFLDRKTSTVTTNESDDDAFSIGKLEKPLPAVVDEEPIDVGSPEWIKGLSDGKRTTARLLKKREKQTKKGLLNYIKVATEHRSASYGAGYKLAFELHFSAVLGTPPSKGQLPFDNARSAPRLGFWGHRYEGKGK